METKKINKKRNHIKVQSLRNAEMRAVQGGTTYNCGDGAGDDCKALVIHTAKADLLSVYKQASSETIN